MVLVRLPGHDRHRTGEGKTDQHGQHLQQRLQPVAEPAPAQAGQHEFALFVQVLALQIDQSPLVAEEGVERRIRLGPGAALADPDRHGRGGADRPHAGLKLGAALRLQDLGHDPAPPMASWKDMPAAASTLHRHRLNGG